ncbi:Hypothetical_protein [Hexamita inflata]|uniref:Hypothetical_protein n=1 Tax=Hexamita inflata TaxID=28002 RepID=A0AA86R8B2_9EUKA|nr:Hypothetical protein HINF_LOCUS51130 [Hexamita inflata]
MMEQELDDLSLQLTWQASGTLKTQHKQCFKIFLNPGSGINDLNENHSFLTRSCSKSSIVDGYSEPVRSCVALGFALLPHPRGLAALAVPFFRQLDGLSNLTSLRWCLHAEHE